ncbi:MAG: M28 family peptidase [Gemmatimonadales bacterium]|nr:MAG: M28 family peptidase [Gemmatimonadales bacterium]
MIRLPLAAPRQSGPGPSSRRELAFGRCARAAGTRCSRTGTGVLLAVVLGACGAPADEGGIRAAGTGASDLEHFEVGELARTAQRENRVSEFGDGLLDDIGARLSGLPSGEAAQDWVEARFREFGLDRVHQEPFDLLAWDRERAEFTVVESASGLEGRLGILSLGHVGSHEVEGPLLDAGFGTAEEIRELGDAVRGTVVMVDVSSPPGYGRGVHRTEKVTLATEAGAIGFLQVNNREGDLVPIGVATMGDVPTEIPAVAADLATGTRLREALDAGPVRVRLEVENWMERTTASNVLGEIRGETDEVIVIGAHLDSWDLAQGAVDNGSGSMAVLDLARALAAHVERTGERPGRTIRFALWMGEELGLYGSRAYVEARLADGTLDRHVATLNLDVVGAPVGLGAMGRSEGNTLLASIRDVLIDAGFPLEEELSEGGGLYSDHQPFLTRGVPVVTVRSRQRPEAAGVSHTTADLRSVIDEEGIAATAAVSAALVWILANVDPLPYRHWSEGEIGERLEALGVRDPLERAGEWRWE